MQNELSQWWQEIAARPSGPFAFRFYLQPAMAIFFAIRDGRRDARAGLPAYGWSLFAEHDPAKRNALLREAWHAVAKIFLLALAIDVIYELIVLRGLRPLQSLLIAVVLALVPYLLLRGPVNRLARRTVGPAGQANRALDPFSRAASAAPRAPARDHLSTDQARKIAEEALVFGYPLVLMDVTRQVMTAPGPTHASINQFHHLRVFPDASFTDVVSPNADTLYSMAWLDLSRGPIVLSLPDTDGRYYLMPLLSAWTDVFESPGKRTTGTHKGEFAIVGPDWKGKLPTGVTELRSPTEMVWLIGRTQTNGTSDYESVNALQNKYRLCSLNDAAASKRTEQPQGSALDTRTPPVEQVARMDALTFFGRLATLLVGNPPHNVDEPMMQKLAQLGVRPGEAFEPDRAIRAELDAAIKTALNRIKDAAQGAPEDLVNGWAIYRQLGAYGSNYDKRALVAWFGLGANLDADAVYPSTRVDAEGQPLSGANRYVLHFEPGRLPPVNAFWSLTLYNEQQAFVDNPIDRCALGDRDELEQNADGSLDLYLQHESPGQDRESNWLPAPQGSFKLILRLYWPKPEALEGAWQPPPVRRVDAEQPERQLQHRESWQKLGKQKGVS